MASISLVYIPERLGANQDDHVSNLTRNEIKDRIIAMKRLQETTHHSCRRRSRSSHSCRRCGDDNNNNNNNKARAATWYNTSYECPEDGNHSDSHSMSKLRSKMCGWLYQAVDHCHLSRELVAIAMSYVDRYVNSTEFGACCSRWQQQQSVRGQTHRGNATLLCSRKKYQLAVLTALQLAMKVHGITIGLPHEEDDEYITTIRPNLIHSCRGIFEESEVIQMEYSMLLALEWRVNGPSPVDFLRHFLALLPTSTRTRIRPNVINTVFSTARYQIELAVAEPSLFVNCIPSKLALAAIANSVAEIDTTCFPFTDRLYFFNDLEMLCTIDNINNASNHNDEHTSSYHNYSREDVSKMQTSLSLLLIGISPSITTGVPDGDEKRRKQHTKGNSSASTATAAAKTSVSPTQCNMLDNDNQSHGRRSIIHNSF